MAIASPAQYHSVESGRSQASLTWDGAGRIFGWLRGTPLPFAGGIRRDAALAELPPREVASGIEVLRQQGLRPIVAEWPGAGSGLPKDAARAVKETLDAFAGMAPAVAR